MLETALRPAVDRAAGGVVTREAVRLAVGPRQYETIRESVATEAARYTMTPLTDPEFSARQSERIEELLSAQDARDVLSGLRRSCFARRFGRTSGCCTSTAPCWGSAPA